MSPRLAANLTLLFAEVPMPERYAHAARAGFEGAEVLFPYDAPAADHAARAGDAGLTFVLLNTPPGDWAGGARGFAAVPGAADRFRRDFEQALGYAQVLRPRHLHVLAGRADGPEARETFIANLAWAAAQAPGQGLTIEPLNAVDQPGYFLADFDTAAGVLDAVAAPNLSLQFDHYHARMIGDAAALWDRHRTRVGHVQIAGCPGRHEPDDAQAMAFLRGLAGDYGGWVSAEYAPRGETDAGLGWMAAWRRPVPPGGEAISRH